MQAQSTTVAPALKALLEGFIDYAGVFPPAALSLDGAVENYERYQKGEYSWMLRWFVVNSADLEQVPASLNGRLAVLGDADEPRAATIESKGIVSAQRPAYCEVPVNNLRALDAVQRAGCFAKLRTGGLKPEAIPVPSQVAAFITACAQRQLPFKATAGLHHPIRAAHPLSYSSDAPRAVMHGFLNVAMASVFAWHGEEDIVPILAETDPRAFSFDDKARWRKKWVDVDDIQQARQEFIHSAGSCSFDEPVQELIELGLI